MNTEAHTFPMPEIEAHKLDELEEQLHENPTLAVTALNWIKENAVASTAAAVVAGYLFSRWFRKRRS
jgi:hypothetical protein